MTIQRIQRCVCGAELDVPDVYGDSEPVQAKCERCGTWWEATGWHPIAPPQPTSEGPWQAIRLWPDRHEGPYQLRYWFEVIDGRPALVGAELWGRPPVERPWPMSLLAPGPATPLKAEATRLSTPELLANVVDHNVNLRAALRQAWDEVAAEDPAKAAALARQKGLDVSAPGADIVRRLAALDEAPERTGRPRLTPELLDEVASVCRAAAMRGEPYTPRIVEHFALQGREISDSTARTWKRKAVEAGRYHDPKGER